LVDGNITMVVLMLAIAFATRAPWPQGARADCGALQQSGVLAYEWDA
jgi:hypothetical protein